MCLVQGDTTSLKEPWLCLRRWGFGLESRLWYCWNQVSPDLRQEWVCPLDVMASCLIKSFCND